MKSLYSRLAAFASITAMAASPAFAQDAATQTDEPELVQNTIVVTVQKREQNLRDVPISVSAVSGDFMDDLGLGEFDEIARFIPGLEVQEQSPNNPGFVIRGLTSDSGQANIEPRVAIFQDGVSISRSRGSIVELFDIERVEVAKGPQPTLFGRGALIGGVNIIQAKPELGQLGGAVKLGGGNFNEVFAEGHVNAGLGDMFAVRLAGRMQQRDGYVESVNPNEDDFNSRDMKAVRFSALFAPNEDFDATLILNWQEDTPTGTSFKSGAIAPCDGCSTEAWEPANLNSFGNFLGGEKLGLDRTVQSATLLADYEINDQVSLSSITGTRHFDGVEVFDPDGFGLPLFIFAEDAQGDQFSQELRLNYADDTFSGFLGASFFKEDGAQKVPLTYDERALQMFFAAGPFGVPPTNEAFEAFLAANPIYNLNLTALQLSGGLLQIPLKPIHNEFFENTGKTEAVEIFADGTAKLTDRFEITGGLRYTSEDKTTGISVGNLNGNSALTGGGIFVTAPTNGRETQSDTFEGFTYRFAATYKLSDSWNLFANYARGRRPEVITASTTSATERFTTLPAEIVKSYETGVKGLLFGGDLSVQASTFRYDYENFQTSIFEDGVFIPLNAGNATSYGIETEANWVVTDNIGLVATYGYNHSRFDDTDDSGQQQQFGGNPFRLSPDHTASLAGFFAVPTGFGEVTVSPSYTWQSQVHFDNTQRDLISQDGYGLLNLNLGWTSSNEMFGVEVYAKNLLDEEYLIDAGNTGDSFGIPTFIAGPPRMFGVRVSAEY